MKRDEQDKSPELTALRRIVRAFLPELSFAGDLEYSVQAQDGAFVALRPTDASLKLPDLPKVPFRGAPGVAAELVGGTKVLVRFVNCDPGRPYVAAVIGADDDGFIPSNLRLDADNLVEIGEHAGQVKIAGGDQFAALANLVSTQLDAIATAFSGHTHTDPDGGSTGAGPTYTPGSVAAARTKVT